MGNALLYRWMTLLNTERNMRKLFRLLVIMGMVAGCGDDDSNPASSSESTANYSETILGIWKVDGDPFWEFKADGSVIDLWYENTYYWVIEGSNLSINTSDGDLILAWEYPVEIKSLSSTQMVWTVTMNKADGSGTRSEDTTFTR